MSMSGEHLSVRLALLSVLLSLFSLQESDLSLQRFAGGESLQSNLQVPTSCVSVAEPELGTS